MIQALVIVVLTIFGARLACRGLDRDEVRYAMGSFALHGACAFAEWVLTEFYFNANDSIRYMYDGAQVARFLEYDFIRFAPEVLKAGLQLDSSLPSPLAGGDSSGTMSIIAGFFVFLVGSSMLNFCLLTAPISWFGQLCLYRVARQEVDVDSRPAALLGLLFVPSVAYWGSGFTKEAFVVGAFGVLALSTYEVLRFRRVAYLVGIGIGGLGVALLKPYVLFSYVIAVAAWIYSGALKGGRAKFRLRPVFLVLAAAVAVGGVAAMGSLFPKFSADRLADSVAQQQEVWQENDAGGSGVEMGSGDARSISEQLRYVPAAVVNSLFRPAIFEARNAVQFGASLETTLLVIGVLSLLGRHSRQAVPKAFKKFPILVFCAVFVGTFAVCVGLATSNLGSLSRYRVPMMPFYAMALLVVLREARAAKRELEERQRLALMSLRRSRSV